jgi:putative hemolysin
MAKARHASGSNCARAIWPSPSCRCARVALPEELACISNVSADALKVEPPALIQGYLRAGAKVLGAPAWDSDFNTADLPIMMRMQDLPSRYRRLFGRMKA